MFYFDEMHRIKYFLGCREQASSASGKAVSGMSSDEKNQVDY